MTYHSDSAAIKTSLVAASPPRLFDEVRRRLRLKHYSLSTERVYLQWILLGHKDVATTAAPAHPCARGIRTSL